MTTYSHTIILDDNQYMAVEAALDLMIRHCDEHLKDGPEAPYYAQRQSAWKFARCFGKAPQNK